MPLAGKSDILTFSLFCKPDIRSLAQHPEIFSRGKTVDVFLFAWRRYNKEIDAIQRVVDRMQVAVHTHEDLDSKASDSGS